MKKKKLFTILILILMMIPTMVFASSGDEADLPVFIAIFMEAFITLHMTFFVLKPLSEIIDPVNSKELFWKMFYIRIVVLLIFDFFITPSIAMFDFISVFIGAFIIVPVCSVLKKNKKLVTVPLTNVNTPNVSGLILKCTKCNTVLQITDKVCPKCKTPIEGNNISVEMDPNKVVKIPKKVLTGPSNYDKMYGLTEDKMLEEFINRQLVKCGVDKNSELIPSDVLKKKKIFNMIFSLLVFIFVSMIFFHFPIYTYIVGIVLLFIFYKVTRRYNLMKYLKKQLKARPSEKVSNIVMNVKTSFVNDDTRGVFIASLCMAIILPGIIFLNPRIMYEKMDNGYGVRFYTFGLTNFTSANIPDSYKGEPVISLRGNTFSNMPFLKEVTLPDTVVEIRGQAFKNDRKLVKVNIPKNLKYLGGGAFYNCTSITNIELPDTLTEMGGEVFYNATSLQSIKLSKNLPEIRGNSFENCSSLKRIEIPDSVVRIGGHAFYENSSLSEVLFTENSRLLEIGSSAFRMCTSLYSITLPVGVSINPRAFKESPTVISYFPYDEEAVWK